MTLSLIAKAEYGDASRWTCIYEANKNVLPSPDKVQAGQELVIP
jgi:nucleoid-associated protein YgaU